LAARRKGGRHEGADGAREASQSAAWQPLPRKHACRGSWWRSQHLQPQQRTTLEGVPAQAVMPARGGEAGPRAPHGVRQQARQKWKPSADTGGPGIDEASAHPGGWDIQQNSRTDTTEELDIPGSLGIDARVVIPVGGADGLRRVLDARVAPVVGSAARVAVGTAVHGAAVAKLPAGGRRQRGRKGVRGRGGLDRGAGLAQRIRSKRGKCWRQACPTFRSGTRCLPARSGHQALCRGWASAIGEGVQGAPVGKSTEAPGAPVQFQYGSRRVFQRRGTHGTGGPPLGAGHAAQQLQGRRGQSHRRPGGRSACRRCLKAGRR
jgi:hypothetical protein